MQVKIIRTRPDTDSVERALDQVGDRWTFLFLREAFFGVRRFDEFKTNTGAAPNIVTNRLRKLVENGIFEKHSYGSHVNRFEYRLSEKGLDLYPMIVLMMRWGDKWASDQKGAPLALIHKPCGHVFDSELHCGECGVAIKATDMDWTSQTS